PMQNLAHSASFHCRENNAPSNSGIKHLGCPISLSWAYATNSQTQDSDLFFFAVFLLREEHGDRKAESGAALAKQVDERSICGCGPASPDLLSLGCPTGYLACFRDDLCTMAEPQTGR